MTRGTRVSLFLFTLLAALLCFAAVGGVAFATGVPGDSFVNSTSLNDYNGSTLTTGLSGTSIAGPGTQYWFKVELAAGDVLNADFTYLPDDDNSFLFQAYVLPTNPLVGTDAISSSLSRLTFVAPASGMYTVLLGTSHAGTFTVAPTVTRKVVPAPIKYGFSSFSAPSSVKKGKKFSLSVRLSPSYPGSASAVKFLVERKVGSKYKPYATVGTAFNGSTAAYSRFAATTKLSTKATYRVRAKFTDATHGATYTGYKSLKVK
jgi:hypothetical protein